MNVTVTDQEKSQKELAITVPAQEWAVEVDAAVAHFGAQIKVDGFRKGKVPKDVVIREVGKEALVAEAAERAIKKAYAQAVKQEKIKAIAQPTIKVTKLAEGNDLVFTATVAVLPEITLAKGYKKAIAKINAQNKKATVESVVDDAAVDAELQKLAQQRAENVLADRPAKKGDVAIIDFTVTVAGKEIDGGKGTDHPLVLGSNSFIPGFEDAVIGMVAGEEKMVTLPFPEKYHAKELAGKDAQFAITLKRVEERIVPTIDDVFAKSVLPQAKTVADLKKQIRSSMEAEKKNALRQSGREALAEELAKHVEGELPDQLIDNEIARMEEQFGQQLAQSGTNIDEMLKRLGKTKEELFKDWRPQAEKRAKIGLALDNIAQIEHVEPEKAKVEAEMQRMMQMYGGQKEAKENVDIAHLYDYTKAMLQQEAVFDYLEGIDK